MKIYTSYFYQIRFFTPNMIPISTAKSDPKWFSAKGVQPDKNGVILGMRANYFSIPDEYWNNSEDKCSKECDKDPNNCGFIKSYAAYLDTLDFNKVMKKLEAVTAKACKVFNIQEEPIIVLLVYESINNPCSERIPLQNWFKKHGVEVIEWRNK